MEFVDVVEKRAAYRALEKVEISDDLIREVAYLASRAPSCANKQPWRFIFVKDKAKLIELHEALTGGNYWAREASLLVAVFSEKELDCVVGDREYYLFGTGMATEQLMLAFVDKGYVAHAMAGFKEDLAKKILNIPVAMRLITLIAVGKKSENLSKLGEKHQLVEKTRSIRKPFEEFAFFNEYVKPTSD